MGHHRGVLLRAGMAVLALLVAGWLALSLHNAVLTNRAVVATLNLLSRGDPAAHRRSALRAIQAARSARPLNPDRTPDISATYALSVLGRRAESLRRLDELARAQPDDAFVWLSLLTLARGVDPAREARARARLAVLEPGR